MSTSSKPSESLKQTPKLTDRYPVGILGVGKFIPPKVLTNFDLEKMVDTTDEWIRTRTGISERHIAESGTPTSDLAVAAGRQALARAGIKPEDLELLIVATITPDVPFPATSCIVQNKLGARNAACFDVNAACAGFVYSITTAQQFIATGSYQNALVIGAEILSRAVDWTDRSTCVLFGDGAGACVLGRVEPGRGIIASYLKSDGAYGDLLTIPAGGSKLPPSHETVDKRLHYLKMEGSEVFKLAVRLMADATENALKRCGMKCEDVDCLIPHQANERIIDAVLKRTNIPKEKVFLNVARYGNMSSASTAVALAEAVETGRIKKGDTVVLVAFGSGLAWGATVVKW